MAVQIEDFLQEPMSLKKLRRWVTDWKSNYSLDSPTVDIQKSMQSKRRGILSNRFGERHSSLKTF
jgi:hypothetical protein